MEPQQQFNIVKSVANGGGNKFVEIVAHYHSHPPGSAAWPSQIDLHEARKGWNIGPHLIENDTSLNAFWWDGKEFSLMKVEIT